MVPCLLFSKTSSHPICGVNTEKRSCDYPADQSHVTPYFFFVPLPTPSISPSFASSENLSIFTSLFFRHPGMISLFPSPPVFEILFSLRFRSGAELVFLGHFGAFPHPNAVRVSFPDLPPTRKPHLYNGRFPRIDRSPQAPFSI